MRSPVYCCTIPEIERFTFKDLLIRKAGPSRNPESSAPASHTLRPPNNINSTLEATYRNRVEVPSRAPVRSHGCCLLHTPFPHFWHRLPNRCQIPLVSVAISSGAKYSSGGLLQNREGCVSKGVSIGLPPHDMHQALWVNVVAHAQGNGKSRQQKVCESPALSRRLSFHMTRENSGISFPQVFKYTIFMRIRNQVFRGVSTYGP